MSRRNLVGARSMLSLMAFATATMIGCAGGDAGAPAASTTTTAAAGPAPTPIPIPTWCTPASPEQVEEITMSLAGVGNKLVDAFTVTTESGYVVIVANMDGASGDRLSSADVWAWHPASGELYAVSSGAQDYSILPASDGLADNPVGDSVIIQTTDCLIASAQARTLDG